MTVAAPAVSVDVEEVWKRFGQTDVVADLSFDVRPGEVLGFLGPNGAGKTTTMRMILDIIRPDRGSITRVRRPARASSTRRASATCPRTAASTATCRIIDTLTYFGALRGLLAARGARRAPRACCTEVGLGDAMTKKAAELSRGMHQKAQLIATILNDPDLLIVDEPFQGLDPVNADDAQGRRARAARPRRGRDHEHARHGRRADAVRPHPAHRQGPPAALRHGRGRPATRSATARSRCTGRRIPTDAGRCAASRHARATDGTVRYLLATAATPRDLFRELAATRRGGRALRGRGTRPRRDLRPHRRRRPARGGRAMTADATTAPAAGPGASRTSWLRLSLLVARRDYLRTVRRRGFIFGTLLLPVRHRGPRRASRASSPPTTGPRRSTSSS